MQCKSTSAFTLHTWQHPNNSVELSHTVCSTEGALGLAFFAFGSDAFGSEGWMWLAVVAIRLNVIGCCCRKTGCDWLSSLLLWDINLFACDPLGQAQMYWLIFFGIGPLIFLDICATCFDFSRLNAIPLKFIVEYRCDLGMRRPNMELMNTDSDGRRLVWMSWLNVSFKVLVTHRGICFYPFTCEHDRYIKIKSPLWQVRLSPLNGIFLKSEFWNVHAKTVFPCKSVALCSGLDRTWLTWLVVGWATHFLFE